MAGLSPSTGSHDGATDSPRVRERPMSQSTRLRGGGLDTPAGSAAAAAAAETPNTIDVIVTVTSRDVKPPKVVHTRAVRRLINYVAFSYDRR